MSRLFATLLLSVWVGSSLGCAMCNRCGDDEFSFFGGTHPRANMKCGRVGSAFDNAEGVAHYSDDESYSDEGQTLEGEIIDDGAAIPAEEILPLPMHELPAEPTPLEDSIAPEASPDSPPSTSAPTTTSRRKTVNPEKYLP